ncbi:MAG: GNAT family N-acetyltransferase [Clostridia bacterium]|nr:GNAT family N-acetyltransferase [Clostridia bacterium]
MNHTGTVTLTTPRLTLRPFTPDDAQDMFTNWASDPEVTKFLTWPTHKSIDVSKWVLNDWIPHYAEPDYYQWAIVYDEQPIGSIAVVNHDDRVGKAEVGYCIGRSWWCMGIVSEALQAVINHLFDTVGYNRIEARHDPRNPHSGGVMKKCGMKYEGTLRQSDWNNQGACDACWYALLKSER